MMADLSRLRTMATKGWNLQRWRTQWRVRQAVHITGLDVDGPLLRVVQSGPRGSRTTVTRVAAQALDLPADANRNDPEVLGKAIAGALSKLCLRPAAVVMGVPRAAVMLRTLSLPMTGDLEELASMVHFQIGKDLPFRMEDAVVDFRVQAPTPKRPHAEKSGEGNGGDSPKADVMVAVVKREVVEFYQRTAACAGLKLTALGMLSYANARCLEECRVPEASAALVSLRPKEVIIDVISRKALLMSRSATIYASPNGAALTEAPPPGPTPGTVSPGESASPGDTAPPENYVEAVTIEVVRSLHSFNGMEPFNQVTKVVLAGASGQEEAVVEALQRRLSIPCSVLDPAGVLGLPTSDRELASASIAALGLVLGVTDSQGLPFDFLHPKRPPVRQDMTRVRWIMGTAAAAACLLFMFGLRAYWVKQRMVIQGKVQQAVKEAERHVKTYRAMKTQVATIKGWTKEGRNWLDHYAWLTAILPAAEDLYVTSLNVSGQGTIHLIVQARTGGILNNLDRQLRSVGYAVKPQAVTPGADKFGYVEASSFELTPPPGMNLDTAKYQPSGRPADDASLDAKARGARKVGR